MSFLDKDILIMKNPYAVLRLTESATIEDIKKAYRNLALEWHPDKNKDKESHEVFIKIRWAYGILSDPEKKQMFDKYGFIEGEQENLEESLVKFTEDLQEDIQRAEEGLMDVRAKNFNESLETKKPQGVCATCDGLGFIEKEEGFFITKRKCKTCGGTGYVEIIIKVAKPSFLEDLFLGGFERR